jgi:hypothetical protein
MVGGVMQRVEEALDESFALDGVLGVALGDWRNGTCLRSKFRTNVTGFSQRELELIVSGNAELIRNKTKQFSRTQEKLEELFLVYEQFFCVVRLVNTITGLFFCLVLERQEANLAHARLKFSQITSAIELPEVEG